MFSTVAHLFTALDQFCVHLSYSANSGFYGSSSSLCDLIYEATPYLVLLLLALPLVVFFTDMGKRSKIQVLRVGLITYLSVILILGVIINLSLKTYWGRPRPRAFVTNAENYRDFWQVNWHQSDIDNSFPSGHASVGFLFGLPFYTLTRKYRYIVYSCLLGIIIGTVRILQGGHYVTDVFFAAVIVFIGYYLITKVVNYFLPVNKIQMRL